MLPASTSVSSWEAGSWLAAVDDVSLASLDAGGTEDSGVLDSFVEDVVFPQAARLNAIAKHKKIAVSFFIMILPFLY